MIGRGKLKHREQKGEVKRGQNTELLWSISSLVLSPGHRDMVVYHSLAGTVTCMQLVCCGAYVGRLCLE